MKMFASLPLYIVTTLFAFGCVSALPSMYKQVPRIVPGVPKQDPGILRSVPKQDKLKADYALPSMYKQVPRILPGVPKQDPGVLRSVPKQDNGSTDAFSSFNSFSDTPCPPDWEQFNNKCYLLDKMTRTWDEAQAFCRDLGTELVKIDDSHENSFVLGLFRQEGLSEVWIGMKSELTWYDCSVPIYTNWESGEPRGQALSPCVVMDSSGQWDDIYCTNDRASVCEKFP